MRFTALVEPLEPMKGLEVPAAVVDDLGGGARPRVVVTVNGHTWRTAIAKLRGRHLIGVSTAHRAAAGVRTGDEVEVDVTLDLEPLTADEPEDLAAALDAEGSVRAAFDALTVSQRRQHIRVIDQAKGAETRARRIGKVVEEMRARGSR
ncbi:YdeI/OmpD-associated family protein [Demequina gelatinilytica]|uniref:YdeI/OmpD-associated family protein n=1 Tax=Demequina gelatinilytica TaxID=1638980 RepID=UPI000783924F|nr:YdeI/OmpD-associated family protein [Demequina gelatinilytica]